MIRFSVGQPIRGKIRGAIVRHLVLILAVGVHYPDFEVSRANQARESKVLVVSDFLQRFWLLRAIDNLLGRRRKKNAPPS